MRRLLVVSLIFLIPFTIFGIQLDFLQGTWRSGERGYTPIPYTCAGAKSNMRYAISITFIKQIRANEFSGKGKFEFEGFKFTGLVGKDGLITIKSKLKYLNMIKDVNIQLKKVGDTLQGKIYGNVDCISNSKPVQYSTNIIFTKKPTNSLPLNLMKKISISTNPQIIKFFDENSIIFGTDFGSLGYLNLRNSTKPTEFPNSNSRAITDLIVSKKKAKIYAASYNGISSFNYENSRDFSIKNDKSYQPNQQAGMVPFRIDSIDISMDEERILASSDGGTVLNSNDLSFMSKISENSSGSLTFSGFINQESIVTVDTRGFVNFFDLAKKTSTRINNLQISGFVWSAKLNSQKTLLAIGSRDISIVDTKTKKTIMDFAGHTNPVTAISFSPDGNLLASASEDFSFRVWNLKTKKQVWALGNNNGASVAFSPMMVKHLCLAVRHKF